jgi:hypothetical protein
MTDSDDKALKGKGHDFPPMTMRRSGILTGIRTLPITANPASGTSGNI